MGSRGWTLFPNTFVRYFFAIALAASTFALRSWLIPLTGTGALIVVYLTFLTKKRARSRNANRQLREADERYRINQAVLDSMAANIAVIDREGNITAVNDAWKRFAYENDGAAVADSVGVNYLHVCSDSPASRNGGWAALNGIQAVLNGTRHNFELEYPCHSPSEKRWFLMSVTPLRGERGGAVVTHTDITTRKQIEDALHESEERLALAMEAGAIGTFEWDIRTNAVVWTEQSKAAFARPSGASRGVYDDWAKRVRPDDRLVCEASIQEVLREKHDHWEAEYRMTSADPAEERWIYSRSHIFYDAQGEPLRMIGVNVDITERKHIELALQESEERFRLTIDEAPVGMALVALDGRFVRVNRALCEIVGYTSAELTALTFQAITHPDDLDADLALRDQLARGEIPRYQLGKRYIRKDGTIVDIELSVSILRTREGAPFYYIAQIEDITERKRAEAALKDSERRLTLALDSAQMGMWDLDLLTDTSVRSLRHDQIFGYSAAIPTWGAAIFMTHVVPEDRDVAKRAFEKAFVSDNFNMECRIRWADESIHWISAKGRVYRNPKGDPVRMMGTVLDVTGQKRAEEALQRSEREFRQLAEAMPQIVWATTADGLNIYFNQQWVDYTGLTLEASYGEGWITPFHPDDRQRAWDAWQRATKHRDIYSLECRLRRADGVYQWWLIRGVPLLDANGEISKWFGTCTDIEQIKVAEQRLQESEAKFSGIVSISADAIISIDEEQRITIFNDGAEQVFGYSKAEAIGTPLGNLMPERFRQTHRQHVERFASGAVTARRMGDRLTTIAGLRKNGEEFPAEAAISRLQVGDKTILTVAMRDITERKRFEKEQQLLAEAGAVLGASLDYDQTLANLARLVVQNFADWCAVDVMDEEGRLSRVKVASADADQAALCALLEQMPPDRDLPHFVQSVSESGRPILVEHVTSEWVESFAQTPEHLQAVVGTGVISLIAVPLAMRGQPLGVIMFGASTRSRVFGHGDLRMAEALADRAAVAIENARLYRSSVRATQLQQVLAEAGTVLAASLDYQQTLATVAHLVVRDLADWCLVEVIDEREQIRRRKIVARDPSKADLCATLEHMTIDRERPHLIRPVFETKQSLLIEHVTSDQIESAAQGPEHLQALRAVNPTSLMAVPLLRHGRVLGMLAFVSSTESRRYGRSDLPLAEALADRAAVAIENARLYEASVHATQLRDQVLGVVAHDLRSPLSTILMQLWALRRHGADAERRSSKPAQVIERAAKRMNHLIQDLLDVAVMESGQLTIERARLSASGLIVEAADMQKPLTSSSSLELRIEADSDLPEVWGDRDRLLQVFENLIGNAIKFTKAGGRIAVGATSRDHEVIFRVADTGSGIAPENLPHVFDRFWQATRTGRQGAGLGLPITKGIIEAHGGRIWVESTPSRGTTFFFTIPEATPEQGRPSGPSGSSLLEGYRAA